MLAENWVGFYENVRRATGIDLKLYKQDQLQRRIQSMVDQRADRSLEGYGKDIAKDAAAAQAFLDRIAINVSELWRNPEKWVEMRDKILPELLKTNSTLKCWSAGCSYGAEAYTLASIFDEKFKGGHKIIGSDIDQAALDQAKRGEFSLQDMRGVPKETLARYFDQDGLLYRAKPALRGYLDFRRGNLLADRFDSGYDLIMCRNVVIYFGDEAKDALYRRFLDALRPGGYLFVGSTERIFNSKELGFESTFPFFYRKPLVGAREWRNAS